MNKKATRSGCVFCGSTDRKLSKEHIWPEWMRSRVPADMLHRDFQHVYEASERGGEFRRVKGQPLFDLTVKGVCEPCNNGWMNRIEGAVRPYVEGMLIGRGRLLHREGQTAIATWGTLKALIAQRSFRDDPSILDEHYRELYDLREAGHPPEPVTVTTARAGWSEGQAEPGYFALRGFRKAGLKDKTERDGYLLTFSALNLVVQVTRLYGDERAEFVYGPRLARSFARIWPPSDSFVWPPGPALTQAGLRSLNRKQAAM